MKSNFDNLQKILREIPNVSSNEYRYLRDFQFLLLETEKKIYHRELVQANYALRMAWDLSKQLIEYLIKSTDSKIMHKWNKNIKDRIREIRRVYEKRGKHFVHTTPGFGVLFDEYPSNVDTYIEGLGQMSEAVKIFNEMNAGMHYKFDTNFKDDNTAFNSNDKSTLYFHRGEVRQRRPSLDNIINYLEAIWLVTIKVLKIAKFLDKEEEIVFDRMIYMDPAPLMEWFMSISYVNQFINTSKRCPICKEGTFEKPDYDEISKKDQKFEHGAFLTCSKEGCWAKLDDSLKIKKELMYDSQADATCPECRKSDAVQYRVNLKEGTGNYVYKACKYCAWNGKNTHAQDVDDLYNNELKMYEISNMDWDEDDY